MGEDAIKDGEMRVADFEQSGKLRSEYRQYLQKYVFGIVAIVAGVYGLKEVLKGAPEIIGANLLLFLGSLLLLKIAMLYAEQLHIATHHIRNQISHRTGMEDQDLVGLQGLRLFVRQRSISGVYKYFIPHWTTRAEYSLVIAMVVVAFLPITLACLIWLPKLNWLNGVSIAAITTVQFSLVIAYLNKNLLDTFAPLATSRVITADNPVPVMVKAQTTPIPYERHIEDRLNRNLRLFVSALLLTVFSLIILRIDEKNVASHLMGWLSVFWTFSAPVEFEGQLRGVVRLVLGGMVYAAPLLFVVRINRFFYDREYYRKGGLGIMALQVVLVMFLSLSVVRAVSALLYLLPGFGNALGLKMLLASLVVIFGFYIMIFRRSELGHSRSSTYVFYCIGVLVLGLVYFLLVCFEPPKGMFEAVKHMIGVAGLPAVVWGGMKAEVYRYVAHGAWKINLFYVLGGAGVLVLFRKAFSSMRRVSREGVIFMLFLWEALIFLMSTLDAGKWYYAFLPLIVCFFSVLILWMNKRHSSRVAGERKPVRRSLAASLGMLAFYLCIGILFYASLRMFRAELWLTVVGVLAGLWCLTFLVKYFNPNDNRPWYDYRHLAFAAVLVVNILLLGAANKIHENSFLMVIDANLHSSFVQTSPLVQLLGGTSDVHSWNLVAAPIILAVNFMFMGVAMCVAGVRTLAAFFSLSEFRSLRKVLGARVRSCQPCKVWPDAEWVVGAPKNRYFRLLITFSGIVVLASAHGFANAQAPQQNPFMYKMVCFGGCGLLVYLVLSQLFFQIEMLFSGSWLTEFAGMHLQADTVTCSKRGLCGDVDNIERMKELLLRHGVEERDFDQLIKGYKNNQHGSNEQSFYRKVVRECIDKAYLTILKQRVTSRFHLSHKVVHGKSEKRKAAWGKVANNDTQMLVNRLKWWDGSSLFTPVRAFLLLPWSAELTQVYDSVGRVQHIWRRRADFITNSMVHASKVRKRTSNELVVMLSGFTPDSRRLLAKVSATLNDISNKSVELLDKFRKITATSNIEQEQTPHSPPHEVDSRKVGFLKDLFAFLDNHSAQIALSRDYVKKSHPLLFFSETEETLDSFTRKDLYNDAVVLEAAWLLLELAFEDAEDFSVMRFVASMGGEEYDPFCIPYIHSSQDGFGNPLKKAFGWIPGLMRCMYHPQAILRLKPDVILMADTSFHNLELARFAKRLNPRIKVAYLNLPHLEITEHEGDTRGRDVAELLDLGFAFSDKQLELYSSKWQAANIRKLEQSAYEYQANTREPLTSDNGKVLGVYTGEGTMSRKWTFELLLWLMDRYDQEQDDVRLRFLFPNRRHLEAFAHFCARRERRGDSVCFNVLSDVKMERKDTKSMPCKHLEYRRTSVNAFIDGIHCFVGMNCRLSEFVALHRPSSLFQFFPRQSLLLASMSNTMIHCPTAYNDVKALSSVLACGDEQKKNRYPYIRLDWVLQSCGLALGNWISFKTFTGNFEACTEELDRHLDGLLDEEQPQASELRRLWERMAVNETTDSVTEMSIRVLDLIYKDSSRGDSGA